MQTPKLKSKNLFTLNRQSNQKSSKYKMSGNSSNAQITENSSDNQSQYPEYVHEQLTSLRLKIRTMQKKEAALEGVISDLENQNELLNQKISSMEGKTKQYVHKLSKQQVNTKELEYQLNMMEQELNLEKSTIESLNRTVAQLALTLKQVVESIGRSPDKLVQVLKKVHSLEIDINVEESIKYVYQIGDKKSSDYKKQMQKLTKQLEFEKSEKKRILPAYNELLNKMRTSCNILKQKVDDVYRKSDADREHYQHLIFQRDEFIRALELKNQKLVQMSKKKSQFSEQSPKMFIGDHKKSRLKKQLSQIDKQILEIQSNLKEQLDSSRFD